MAVIVEDNLDKVQSSKRDADRSELVSKFIKMVALSSQKMLKDMTVIRFQIAKKIVNKAVREAYEAGYNACKLEQESINA